MNPRVTEHLSISKKFKLIVTSRPSEPGCWDVTKGEVFRVDSDAPIASVERNYSSFPHLFLERHPEGDFLLCGEDYQGQTVVDLASGKKFSHRSNGAAQGVGFCWASYRYDAGSQILIVSGCYWGAGYEFKFFDFSNPRKSWPELEADHPSDDYDQRWPEILPDGSIRTFLSEPEPEDAPDDFDESAIRDVASIQTFRREGLKLVRTEEWLSSAEVTRRSDRQRWKAEHDAWWANFKASDELYLACKRLRAVAPFTDSYDSIGTTYAGWCPDFSGSETRICSAVGRGKDGTSVDVEWGVKTAPIKVSVHRPGNPEAKFFPHSVGGMESAFLFAKGILQ